MGERKRIVFAFLILSFVTLSMGSFALASSGSLSPSDAGNGTTIRMLWFNVSNLGTTANTLTSITVALHSTATASVGNITNVTLSDGTNVYYNDSFSSGPVVIPVSAAITANTNYTLNFTISPSAADSLTIGANVTAVSAGANVTYSSLPYTSTLSTIDSLPPYAIYGTGTPNNDSNLSQSYIYVNISASDTVSSLGTMKIYLYNSNHSLINSSANSSLGATSAVYGFKFTNLSDGTYYVNATVNDSFNHVSDLPTRKIVLDTIAPTVSFSCDSSSVSEGGTLTCSCSGTDATSGVKTTSYARNPSTSSAGTFSTRCTVTDYAGNSASSSFSYTVTSSGGGWGGYPNFNPTNAELNQGYEKVMFNNWEVSFNINNEPHTFKVESTTKTSATISVSSTPQVATLSVGQEKKFDLSGDGYYDLLIRLNSIDTTNVYDPANFTIQTIHEKISSAGNNTVNNSTTTNSATSSTGTKKGKSNLAWLWILIAVVIVIIAGAVFGLLKKRPKRRKKKKK